MKTYYWFKRNRLPSHLIPLLLSGFAAVFISAPTPAAADTQVPFNGITGTAEFVLNVCDLTYIGSYVFTAANDDSISGPFSGYLTPTPTPGVFDNTEIAFITAGSGRFANATGMFDLGGQINTNTGTFSLPWQGTISTVGSTRTH